MIWPTLFILVPTVMFRIGIWLGSGHKSRVSAPMAVVVLVGIVLLSRVFA